MRKTLFTLIFHIFHPLNIANITTTLTVMVFTIRLNVSLKYTPNYCKKPLAANLAIYLSKAPLTRIFTLNDYLQIIWWTLIGNTTNFEVSFSMRASSSFCIAYIHKYLETLFIIHWFWDIHFRDVIVTSALGLNPPALEHVTMVCVFNGSV